MVASFDAKQKLVAIHESISEASKFHQCDSGSVTHVVNGERKRANNTFLQSIENI